MRWEAGAAGAADGDGVRPPIRQGIDMQTASVHRDENNTVILVAENETNNRRLIEHILGIAGYGYVSASNGLEVLQILDTCQVDVVLLDLSMPFLDG